MSRPNPFVYDQEGLTFTAVVVKGDGTAATGLTFTAEVLDGPRGTKINTGSYTSTESPSGTYKATIPYTALTAAYDAVDLGTAVYPTYRCPGIRAQARKTLQVRPMT